MNILTKHGLYHFVCYDKPRKSRIELTTGRLSLLFTSVMLLIFCMSANAQTTKPNLKFGSPTTDELKMSSYPADANASAVILYKTTDVSYEVFSGNFKLISDVRVKIKVLKPEGKDEANVEIPYVYDQINIDARESVNGLKATAYNLENDKVVKTNMTKDMIFTERIDKRNMLLKFTVPQVKVGTVIEYKYRLESSLYYTIDDWYAQTTIPTLYAEYHLVIPEYFKFNIEETGMSPLKKTTNTTPLTFFIGADNLKSTGNDYDFIGTELPAVKDDDFVWHSEDYCSRIVAELSRIEIPGQMYHNYTSDWTDIDKMLISDSEFGGRLHKSNPYKDKMAAAGIAKIENIADKVAATYMLLKKNLRWDGMYRFWGASMKDVLKAGTGNNADLNFILINMLEDVGVKAVPIVMRSRDAGRLPLTHPTIKSLNTFVVGAYINDTTMVYIDSSVDDGFLNVLPSKLLVDRARIISKDNCSWVNLQTVASSKINMIVNGKIDASGLITGTISTSYRDNAAAKFRLDYRQAKDSVTFYNQEAEKLGIDILKWQTSGVKDFSPAVTTSVSFTKKCDSSADHIYVNPLITPPIKENPFSAVERNLPVEFSSPQMVNVSVSLSIPDGYTVEGLNNGVKINTPDNSMMFKYIVLAENNVISLQCRLNVNELFYSADKYPMIKDEYAKICEKCKDVIVLKKL
ncbi:MAG: DUF3857 domain-containing protein [Bacteroidaceae bacterium]|nr:DUF3857 domain-containing protein [Bacteroidaceae bacterium]